MDILSFPVQKTWPFEWTGFSFLSVARRKIWQPNSGKHRENLPCDCLLLVLRYYEDQRGPDMKKLEVDINLILSNVNLTLIIWYAIKILFAWTPLRFLIP